MMFSRMAAEQFATVCCAVLFLSASCSGFLHNTRDSIADDLTLLSRYAVDGEEVFHEEKRSFPVSTAKGKPGETGFVNLENKNNELYGIIFGHLVLKDNNKRGDDYYKCEAVLIGPRHALVPVKDCGPKGAGTETYDNFKGTQKYHQKPVDAGADIVFLYTKGNTGTKKEVKVESIWAKDNSKYGMAFLDTSNDLANIEYPIVSWIHQNSVADYQLCLEIAANYPLLLSTPTVTQALTGSQKKFQYNYELSKVLSNAEFMDCQRYPAVMTLVKKGLPRNVGDVDASVGVPGMARPLSGAAYFKLLDKTAAIVGIRSDSMTGECEKRPPPPKRKRGQSSPPQKKTLSETFQCGHRFRWSDAKSIYELGMAVDPSMPRSNDVIPNSETVIGSWNFQHTSNMEEKRALSTKVYEALEKVIDKTSILALQEVENFDSKVKGTYATPTSLQLLKNRANLEYAAEGEFAFVFNKNKVQLVDTCEFLEVDGHKYAYQCQFKLDQMAECFTMYSSHFRAGDDKDNQDERDNEFKHFSKHAQDLWDNDKKCGRVQIIAGDFNTKDNTEVRKVAHYFTNFRLLQAGPTKPGSGRIYDYILVSETLRSVHRYVWPGRKLSVGPLSNDWEALQEPYAETFYPRDESATPLRQFDPVYHSSDLSDHLPVQMVWNGLNIGTWNIIKSRQPGTVAPPLEQLFTRVLSLFSVLAIQELLTVPPSGTYGREWTVSSPLRDDNERLGFAYDSTVVRLIGCEELDLDGYVHIDERRGYGCEFETIAVPPARLTVINLHLLNANNHNRKSVNSLIDQIRTSSTTPAAGIPVQKWLQAYIMGDFNCADLEKKWTGADAARRCEHSKDLNDLPQPWAFTRLPSKLTLDYIFAPDSNAALQTNHVPGQAGCRVLHPELETIGGNPLIPDDTKKNLKYSFFGSWTEISDHYPVFMKFEELTEPQGGTPDARRKSVDVKKIWP
jgi:endonuclease/exonuclease/phosphatase family metal-dependent hydrolase